MDEVYIRRTFELAERGIALVSPGALVGALIVKGDQVIGEGSYTYDGIKHAEIHALEQAGDRARGATVYTSLEPCSHHGRTPPCAQTLIDAGVKRVVTALQDPNPLVNGQGLAMLSAAGIETQSGVLDTEARQINEAFITYKTQQRPFGILKIAMTLDGKIATAKGESQWITSEESRAQVQRLRHRCDAVITGSGTFIKDKPQLSDRTGLPRRRSLLRVILDRRGRVKDQAGFFVFRDSLKSLANNLFQREIQSFLLECGPDLAFSALHTGIIDKMIVFVAPRILGGRETLAIAGEGFERLADSLHLKDWTVAASGTDIAITAYVHRNH